MAIDSAHVSVGNATPTKLAEGTPAAGTGSVPGSHVLLRNKHASVSVYLGDSAVASSDGFELAAGEAAAIDLETGEVLYAIAASGTVTVHKLVSGV